MRQEIDTVRECVVEAAEQYASCGQQEFEMFVAVPRNDIAWVQADVSPALREPHQPESGLRAVVVDGSGRLLLGFRGRDFESSVVEDYNLFFEASLEM